MLFNSSTFLVFFAVVLMLQSAPLPWTVKKFNLLIASYLFYAAWNPPFVLLLMFSTVADFLLARAMDKFESPGIRRVLLITTLVSNLGLLGFFKYGGFFLENLVTGLATLGITYHPPVWDIVLPAGISFYTFQTLSYTLDVYQRRMRAWPSFLDFALFITFFPQLVAGPIVRAVDFLPQLTAPRRATAAEFGWGMFLVVLGLFQKVVVADCILAPVADGIYAVQNPGTLAAWCGTIAFSGQIFCDFAGYSTCAIGVALCLGFHLNNNFHWPYAAIGFSDFWQRWHISLSTWLRDYLYIPLGGNRKGPRRTAINLMLTMLLGGLWHGAAWTFVVWGGLHGTYLMVERAIRPRWGQAPIWHTAGGRLALGVLTYLLVCLTWVYFRAKSFPQAYQFTAAMFGWAANSAEWPIARMDVLIAMIAMAILLCLHWTFRDRSLEHVIERAPAWMPSALLTSMILMILTTPGQNRAFIYFQF